MSKLYTKEMFLIAAEKCEVSMIDAKHIMQYIDEYVTPIQLPTDEVQEKSEKPIYITSCKIKISDKEIEKASKYWNETTNPDMWTYKLAWKAGAKWMRDKIKGGQDE